MLKKKIVDSLPLLCAFWTVQIFIRICGWILLTEGQYLTHPGGLLFEGLYHDVVFGAVLFPLFLLIQFIRNRTIRLVIQIFVGLLLVFELLSAFYFNLTLYPIDRTIYQFSLDELYVIVRDFGAFHWYYVIALLLVPMLLLSERLFRKKNVLKVSAISLALVVLTVHLFAGYNAESRFEALYTKNGVAYFVSESVEYFKDQNKSNQDYLPKGETQKYQLIHPVAEANPLGPYFDLKDKPPNFVFLIVESLSASFSGPAASEISLSPFLDSLAQHSLYFKNFLSTAERTFGVLPSSLASLPHGELGFLKMEFNMPEHESIVSLLVKNGYNATFFYGGDADYDYMRTFMENNGVATIVDYHDQYLASESPWEKENGEYGKTDQVFFKATADGWQNKLKTPFIHCYLTLTTHTPFRFENQPHYEALTRKLIKDAAENSIANYRVEIEKMAAQC